MNFQEVRLHEAGKEKRDYFFYFNHKLYYYAGLLFIYVIYCAYALYLVVYLYLHLAEQVQPCTRAKCSGNVSP